MTTTRRGAGRPRARRAHPGRRAGLAVLPLLAALAAPGCGAEPGSPDLGAVSAPLTAYCTAKVTGDGTLDVETDYLPHVVTCEDGGGGPQALRAQAIAARTYLYYKLETSGSIGDGQGDQVYTCSASPGADQIQAVKDTAGMVLQYNATTIAAFFVAGAFQTPPSCAGGTDDPSGTEGDVTYNEGLSGANLHQTPLGFVSPSNDRNRGCMSQNGANCLSDAGDTYQDILEFYYGADIQIVTATGSCVTADAYAAEFVSQTWPYASAAPIALVAGKTKTGSIDLKNVGTATWKAGVVKLAPIPRDKASDLQSPSWLSATRVSTVAADVAPGATGHFEWDLTGSTVGSAMPFFGLVAEGIAWFADQGGPPDNDIQINVVVAAAPKGSGGASGSGGSGEAGKAGAGGKSTGGAGSAGEAGKAGEAGAAGKGGEGGAAGAAEGGHPDAGDGGAGGSASSGASGAGAGGSATEGGAHSGGAAGTLAASGAGTGQEATSGDASSSGGCAAAQGRPTPAGAAFGLGAAFLLVGRRRRRTAQPYA